MGKNQSELMERMLLTGMPAGTLVRTGAVEIVTGTQGDAGPQHSKSP